MNVLELLVKQMNNEDIRMYKSYVKRSGKDATRLDLRLFEAYQKGKTDDDAFSEENYGKEGSGAFHRLKNRVLNDINKSELLNLFDEHETQPHLLFALYINYYNRNQFELAYRYLLKAEKKAIANEDLRLLDEIYAGFLRLVREIPAVNPPEIVQKIRNNEEVLHYRNRLEELSSLVSHRMRSSQNYAPEEMEELTHLAKLADKGIRIWLDKGYPVLSFQILKAYCQPLILKGNFKAAAEFLNAKIDLISNTDVINARMSELRIELLIYLTNSLNASGAYDEATHKAEFLKTALEQAGDVLYKKFVYFYYQSLVNAYSELKRPDKSLEILDEMQEKNVAALNPMYEVFLWVNKAVCLFDLKEYSQSAKTISRLYTSRGYKGITDSLKLKIETAELIIRFERGDMDFAEFKIPRLIKDYRLKPKTREYLITSILLNLSTNPDYRFSDIFRDARTELNLLPADTGQELIDYSLWLENRFGSIQKNR